MKPYSLQKVILIVLLMLAISACGVLEIGVEPPAEEATATTEIVTTEPDATPSPDPTVPATETPPATEQPPTEEATPPATATPRPAPETPEPGVAALQVAYVKDENVYLWSAEHGEQALTRNGGVDDVRLSNDEGQVAFIRGGHLWVVATDGTNERQLTNDETFAAIDYGSLAESVLQVGVYQMEWIPGTNTLLFNTFPQLEGPGLILTDDLWRADAQSGAVENLLPKGQGGNPVLSPDGTEVALVTPGSISIATVDGTNLRQVFTYSPVVTYSEYQYYVTPVWAPEGDSLLAAIPPSDPLATPVQPTSIWELFADGRSARLVGQVTTNTPLRPASVSLSPNVDQLAFLLGQGDPGGASAPLMLAAVNAELGEPMRYAEEVDEIHGWSPDGAYVVFARLSNGTPALLVGRPGAEPQSLGSPEMAVLDLQWADNQQFVYLEQSSRGWDIILANVSGDSEVIAGVSGTPPNFDVDK